MLPAPTTLDSGRLPAAGIRLGRYGVVSVLSDDRLPDTQDLATQAGITFSGTATCRRPDRRSPAKLALDRSC